MPADASAPAPSLPVDRENLRSDVDARLSTFLEDQRVRLAAISEDAAPLSEATAALLTGGKRLRAAFCYWSWRAHGGRVDDGRREAAVRTGAALELFQAAALFHDDVMDNSDMRRGRPAAHRAFAGRHRASGWSGSAAQYGSSSAILLGDLCLIASQAEIRAGLTGLPEDVALRTRALFDDMQTEVTVGQYLDVLAQAVPWGTDLDADEARARAVIRSKSARYSVEHPLALGAALAGAPTEALDAVSSYGLPLGEAFQLRDDVLGVYGDPSVTGKPAGDDLREGKRTVLVSRALRTATPSQSAFLLESLGNPDLDQDTVESLRGLLVETGAVAAVEQLISHLTDEAFAALDAAALASPGTEMVAELARAAVQRSA
ncbi:polyprenyl synthetase family protein [Oerskovia turbata]|uniref:Polyprenyl synthetase family protein n=1 Tax=Oerskovia turbata TaxID=1713 RepID=A0A4V1N4E6_9CELL|nr:polyprenyl synthetase family protein [Oerskovia turbata]RXR23156.1 polyprenyl synthetase family protein [Oerskovia turbata]RXR31896.1 polyprenyl synthetase family protein [Oerskovia turbata]TGJ97176.1 polyprenyl synthetase family protein [Actinotalea fermentans ATCC 43279 = JCM 9966 = DSM 3133]